MLSTLGMHLHQWQQTSNKTLLLESISHIHTLHRTQNGTTCDLAESPRCWGAYTLPNWPSLLRYLQFSQMPLCIFSFVCFLLSFRVCASLFAFQIWACISDGREKEGASRDLENTRDMFANRQCKRTDWLTKTAVTAARAQLKGNLKLQIGSWVKVQW